MINILRHFAEHSPRWVVFLIAAIAIANLVALLAVGTHTDEAFYWLWSERLAWGYYDHPPMIAWLVRLFTTFFGDNGAAIRIPAYLTWIAVMILSYDLASRMFPDRKAAPALAILVLAGAPLFQFGSHIITPDVPFVLFSTLGYYLFYRALVEDRTSTWILAGIAVGATALSKYNAILIPFSLLPAMLVTEAGKKAWTQRGFWLAIVSAAVVSSPVFIWNYLNDWISISYQLGHGTGLNRRSAGEFLGLYISGQMANVLPWIFLLMLASVLLLYRKLRQNRSLEYWLLSGAFLVPLVFFGILGTLSKSEPNWPAMAYVPGSLLVGYQLSAWLFSPEASAVPVRKWLRNLLVLSTVLSILLVNLVRFPDWAWLFEKKVIPDDTQIPSIYGWTELGQALRKNAKRYFDDTGCTVLTGNHLLAGQLALQLKSADRISFATGDRVTQFHIWADTGEIAAASSACLYVRVDRGALPLSTNVSFSGIDWILVNQVAVLAPDRTTRYYSIFRRKAQ